MEQLGRLISTPSAPKDHYTKKSLERRKNAEHIVIIGYYKEFLIRLISELKEGSNDYLKDTMCNKLLNR